jgi:hypothetical protein
VAVRRRIVSRAVELAAELVRLPVVQILRVPVRTPADLDEAFALMARERVNGFLAVASPLTRSQRTLLAELSLKHRFAGMFGTRENVEAGVS